jgi:hypothetical protein
LNGTGFAIGWRADVSHGSIRKEVKIMAGAQRIKNRSRPGRIHTIDKIETRGEVKEVKAPPKQRSAEQPEPISKQREWKLLYSPYPFGAADDGSAPVKGPRRGSGAEEESSTEQKGLCRNCKKEKTCKLPRPEGGVWRCEDYE